MKTGYHIRETYPDNWALCYESSICVDDMDLQTARAVLREVESAESDAMLSLSEAEREAQEAARSEALAREESEKLLQKFDLIEDREKLLSIATRAQEIANAVEALGESLTMLKCQRGTSGTLCPPFVRGGVDALIRGEYHQLRELVKAWRKINFVNPKPKTQGADHVA